MTANNIDRFLAMLVQGTVVSAPRIASKIDKRAIIGGTFTNQEIDRMVTILNRGIAPKPTWKDKLKTLLNAL